MIIFLYGEDSFRRGAFLEELIAPYKAKYADLDLKVFDLEDKPDSWLEARDFLNQPSMFVESKVLIVKDATAVEDKEWVKILKSQVEQPKNFVFISQKSKPTKKFGFLLEKPAKSREFRELEGAALENFLKKEIADRGLRFAEGASRFFLSYIAASLERSALAANELEKIRLLGTSEEITLRRLREVIRFEKREEVWMVASAILREGSAGRRLGLLERVFLGRQTPSYVFNSLGFQARGKSALRLADYDISVKSGGLEYEEALTDFVISSQAGT
ncbi:MAG: hypothetical protein HY378_00185, partial [Candidatus Brennerbacteria bacterium]|nr:hypothetical protein [Candidatus Brennerbacteria bacterium]